MAIGKHAEAGGKQCAPMRQTERARPRESASCARNRHALAPVALAHVWQAR